MPFPCYRRAVCFRLVGGRVCRDVPHLPCRWAQTKRRRETKEYKRIFQMTWCDRLGRERCSSLVMCWCVCVCERYELSYFSQGLFAIYTPFIGRYSSARPRTEFKQCNRDWFAFFFVERKSGGFFCPMQCACSSFRAIWARVCVRICVCCVHVGGVAVVLI